MRNLRLDAVRHRRCRVSEPFSMKESAVAMHEFFANLKEAGFNDQQALWLVCHFFKPDLSGGAE